MNDVETEDHLSEDEPKIVHVSSSIVVERSGDSFRTGPVDTEKSGVSSWFNLRVG
jgi:hypothetical protein